MAFSSRSYAQPYLFGDRIPPGVKALLIVHTAVFVLGFLLRGSLAALMGILVLSPVAAVQRLYVWQFATYIFVPMGIWNLVWNLLALWMFGCELEQSWGTRRFVQFYLGCGAAAGACSVVASYAFGSQGVPIAGASGAIYALLAAYAGLWPDRMILAFFMFPMKLKYFIGIIAAIDFFISYNGSVGQTVLLTGIVFGLLYVKAPRFKGFHPIAPLQASYRAWKLKRAKKKFQVYLRKQRSGDDRWVN